MEGSNGWDGGNMSMDVFRQNIGGVVVHNIMWGGCPCDGADNPHAHGKFSDLSRIADRGSGTQHMLHNRR